MATQVSKQNFRAAATGSQFNRTPFRHSLNITASANVVQLLENYSPVPHWCFASWSHLGISVPRPHQVYERYEPPLPAKSL